MAVANGLIDAAEATHNPCALSFALSPRLAFRDADPDRARDALRRGLVIAQDSGNRETESLLAALCARLEAKHGDPLAALDYVTLAIRNYHDAGNITYIACAPGCPRRLFRPARTPRISGHHRWFRPQSAHRDGMSPKSAPRSPTSAMSSATRPTNRSPARARR